MGFTAPEQHRFMTPLMMLLMDNILHDPVHLNYGNYGAILYLGHAGFCPSVVWPKDFLIGKSMVGGSILGSFSLP